MDVTWHLELPPRSFTTTLIDPDDVLGGADMVGPGIGPKGAGGDGTGEGGGGDGDVFGTKAYLLTSFHLAYVLVLASLTTG